MRIFSAIKRTQDLISKAFFVIIAFSAVIFLFSYLRSDYRIDLSETQATEREQADFIYEALSDPFFQTEEGKFMASIYKAGTCNLIGVACTDDPADDTRREYLEKSFSGQLANLMVLPLYNPPASGIHYIATKIDDAGFIPKTYAAEGIGFASLKPFSNIWRLFRDISYFILVLVLIIIGFMIMFRMKLNAQTVISLETALPKIVLSMILITFSLPIAGFMIDLMYVFTGMAISLLSKSSVVTIDTADYYQQIFAPKGGGIFFLFSKIAFNGNILPVGSAFFDILPLHLGRIIKILFGGTFHFWLIQKIDGGFFTRGKLLQDLPGGGLWSFILMIIVAALFIPTWGFIAPIVLSLFVFFTAIATVFKILFMLFSAYLRIILLILFAPLLFLIEAIPGKAVFGGWVKNIAVSLLAFPLVVVLMIVSSMIIQLPSTQGNFWQPPFTNSISPNAFTVLVGIGILFLIPKLYALIRELLGVKDLPISFGAGTFFAGGAPIIGAGRGALAGIPSLVNKLPYKQQLQMKGITDAKKGTGNPNPIQNLLFGTEAQLEAQKYEYQKAQDLLNATKANKPNP